MTMSTVHALIQEIKGCLDRAQKSEVNAKVWQARAGERLDQLKEKVGHGSWEKHLRKDLGISQQRASELMAIGKDINALERQRERVKQAMRKNRAKNKRSKSPSRDGDLPDKLAAREVFLRKLGCNYNPENPEHVAEPNDTPEEVRRRVFLYHAEDSVRHAKENGFDKAKNSEIDDEIISAAQAAAEAWADLHQQLLARHTARKGGYPDGTKISATGKALH